MGTEQTRSGTSEIHPAPEQQSIHVSTEVASRGHVPAGARNDVVESSQDIGPRDTDDDSQTFKQSSWICQVHAALAKPNTDTGNHLSQVLIRKVPAYYRTNAELYEPVAWQFGLHHCPPILRTNGTERFKVEVARALQLQGERWDSFCKYVVQEPKNHWETVYAESTHASSYTIEEIRCLLSLDALFLVVILQWSGGGILNPALQEVLEKLILHPNFSRIQTDMLLVENQIPMELMKRVVGKLHADREDIMPLWKLAHWEGKNIGPFIPWHLFSDPTMDDSEKDNFYNKTMANRSQHGNYYSGCHIFDNIYRTLCGPESMKTRHAQNPRLTIPSASHLESCGVTIKPKEFTCFEDISFENGYLLLPCLLVDDFTEIYLRNAVVHEYLSKNNIGSARGYTVFMDDLMKTPDDVRILIKQGVVAASVGSYDNVVDMWKRINYRIDEPKVSNKFYHMLVDVRNYASQRRNKFRFEFMKQFCSRPWIPLSVLAVTFVTIATGIQTYVAVTSSNGMKPSFQH